MARPRGRQRELPHRSRVRYRQASPFTSTLERTTPRILNSSVHHFANSCKSCKRFPECTYAALTLPRRRGRNTRCRKPESPFVENVTPDDLYQALLNAEWVRRHGAGGDAADEQPDKYLRIVNRLTIKDFLI